MDAPATSDGFAVPRPKQRTLVIRAFSYKKGGGAPPAAALLPGAVVIDCRVLDNVWRHAPTLRGLSGKDQQIIDWLFNRQPLQANHLQDQAMDAARKQGARAVWFGCDHGKHRSVAMAVEFAKRVMATNPRAGVGQGKDK
jgi:RNase adaptor protein for sRNA GlmZ degradation